MAVSDASGNYADDEFEYWHKQTFPQQQETKEPSELYLVRHGDTAMNDENLVHGWVNTPLNDKGIEQAHKTADSLKDKDITNIVSSDLPRAKQTANIIGDKLKIPVTFDPSLRTWDSGNFDGTDKHKELEQYTQAQSGGTSLSDIKKMEAPDVKDNPESIPGFVDKYGEIVVSPSYEYYDKASDSNKLNSKVKEWLDKGNLPDDIDREDFGQPGMANHLIILRKKNLNTPVGENTRPPGSSESFAEFKGRVINSMMALSNNEQGKTVVVTHSKPIAVMDGWAHAGYPEDNSIHQATYQESRTKDKTGNSQLLDMPDHIKSSFADRFSGQPQLPNMYPANFLDRFEGEPNRLPTEVPGETYDDWLGRVPHSLKTPQWPSNEAGGASYMTTPYYPRGDYNDKDSNPASLLKVGDVHKPIPVVPSGLTPKLTKPEDRDAVNTVVANSMKGNTNAKMDLSRQHEAIRSKVAEGKSIAQISDELNLSKFLVTSRIKELGLDFKPSNAEWSTAKSDRLRQMVNQGSSYSEIAKELDISRSSVAGKLNRLK